MIAPMRLALVAAAVLLVSACSSVPPDPIQLKGNAITVENQSEEEWRNVEIWVNNYYRALAPSILPRQRLQLQLDAFVSGYGQRFDFKRAPITDLRLSARRPNGDVVELKKALEGNRLEEALGGK